MEVMDSRDIEQKEIIIGQHGTSSAMSVSDDAMLMSMLSTGLYQFPLRTMLQEILFNAWDAHRMGNCQDTPFDVYLNETTGLIVRDYGPGIDPDDMVPIYCVYGNSTKRDNKKLTGGFGLGSKSPFAYTDSFSVTSMFEGKKNMYMLLKSSDEHEGKPGITDIISNVDTDESGLMVTVPLKNEKDRLKAYEHIKNIAFLSGMKFNLHFTTNNKTETTLIESDELVPGAFLTDTRESGIFAVYGGVRYKIVNDPEYDEEYRFLSSISHKTGAFYIGFRPNSLTPVPSREGLNLSNKTKESIKSHLELIHDTMRDLIRPILNKAAKFTIDALIKTKLPEEFITYRWASLANTDLISGLSIYKTDQSLTKKALKDTKEWRALIAECPDSIIPTVWESLLYLAVDNTSYICKFAEVDIYVLLAKIHYLRFRDSNARKYILSVNSEKRSDFDYLRASREKTYSDLITVHKSINLLVGKHLDIRTKFSRGDNWVVVKNIRAAGKAINSKTTYRQEQIIKALSAKNMLKSPSREHYNRLWSSKSGYELTGTYLPKTIIVAKTVTALNVTSFSFSDMFSKLTKKKHGNVALNNGRWFPTGSQKPVPAIVVRGKKGDYVKVIAHLRSEGWRVYTADEPEVKKEPNPLSDKFSYDIPKVKVLAERKFPLIDVNKHHWVDRHADKISDPKVYIWVRDSDFDTYYYRNPLYPLPGFVKLMQALHPKMVLLNSKGREGTIIKMGAISFAQAVENRLIILMKNTKRFKNLYLHSLVRNKSNFPTELIELPEMQKRMGLQYIRSNHTEGFYRDIAFITYIIKNENDHVFSTTQNLLHKEYVRLNSDPKVSEVVKACAMSKVFDSGHLKNLISKKRGENKVLSEKIIRFLRTL